MVTTLIGVLRSVFFSSLSIASCFVDSGQGFVVWSFLVRMYFSSPTMTMSTSPSMLLLQVAPLSLRTFCARGSGDL
tara:strand:+ start:799 stop:1026 length:228 start_codon:yes stop_codon:yes gene_type:complete